jgi:2-oxoglutarate ferredoxin oxidoreductase subunit gamma
MRGGTAHCTVVVSDKPIGSPVVSHPQIVIAFNNPSFQKYEPLVARQGLLVYNASLIAFTSERTDIDVLPIPASDIADKLGNLKLLNVVLLGAALTARPVISLDAVRRALEIHLPSHHRDLLPLNFLALERGSQHLQAGLSTPHIGL